MSLFPPSWRSSVAGVTPALGGLSPSLPAGVCSPPCLLPGRYQSLLRKDSTQDSSRSDFRAHSAPPIKLQAARWEDKQSPLSPISGPSAPRAPQKGHVRWGRHARTCGGGTRSPEQRARRGAASCPRFVGPLREADGGYLQAGTKKIPITAWPCPALTL